MPKLNLPEALKVAGFLAVVGAAFFAPTGVRVALFVGGVLMGVGYVWSRVTA